MKFWDNLLADKFESNLRDDQHNDIGHPYSDIAHCSYTYLNSKNPNAVISGREGVGMETLEISLNMYVIGNDFRSCHKKLLEDIFNNNKVKLVDVSIWVIVRNI